MLGNVTSLTGNGLKDWLIQRVTAIYFALYVFYVLGFIFMHPQLDYAVWHGLFHTLWFQIATALAILNLCLHAWIGIWTISTDYISCYALRLSFQVAVVFFLLAQFIWALLILWGQQ